MLIILSPAKTMDMSVVSDKIPASTPFFIHDAKYLADKMRDMSLDELKKQLKISDNLAVINHKRYQYFDSSAVKQAILAYNGNVFKAIKAKDFSIKDREYAQDRIRIISTLYGVLRPFDMIRAYRMTFDLKIEGIDGNLYDYWLPRLTSVLIHDANAVGGVIVNLASHDVLGTIDMELLEKKIKIITPEFHDFKDGKYEIIHTCAKMARGEMTKYVIQNKIEDIDKLKKFVWKEFRYNEKMSNDNNLIFTRKIDNPILGKNLIGKT